MYRDYDPVCNLLAVRPKNQHNGVNPSMEDSITFHHLPDEIESGFRGEMGPDFHIYGRFGHPSLSFLARQFNAIEDAGYSIPVSSGQAAMAMTINSLLECGDHLVASNRLYGGTVSFLDEITKFRKIKVTWVDINNPGDVEIALKKKRTKLFVIESVSNPSLVAANIPLCARLAHDHGAYLMVDNTFMPLVVLPLRLGADIVIHSMTKYSSGQSDMVAGITCLSHGLSSSPAVVKQFKSYLSLLGPVLYHGLAHEISKRLSHLRVRFREGSHAAAIVSYGLTRLGFPVHYPGLSTYPYRDTLRSVMLTHDLGYGSVLTADFGSGKAAKEFAMRLDELLGAYSAVSLGSGHTYVCAPLASVHCAPTDKVNAGQTNHRAPPELTPGLVRIACGYDLPPEQLWETVRQSIE